MITNSKQNWQVGETVKVGFLILKVVAVNSYNNRLPDQYALTNGDKFYRFIPHNGLTRCFDLIEAIEPA